MLVTDQPEDLPTTDALASIEDPDEQPKWSGERAELYLSGAHVATLDDAPSGGDRFTMMVDLRVQDEATRFNEDGEEVASIRKLIRVGDFYLPGTQRPPTREEIKVMQAAAKAKAAAEAAAREEAERAEQEHNEPPMFNEEGDPIDYDAKPADGDVKADNLVGPEPVGDDQDAGPEPDPTVVQFSDKKGGK